MQDITTTKDAGLFTALQIMHAKVDYEYGSNGHGISSNFGTSSNQLAIHIDDGQSTTAANAILTAIATPTCTSSGLVATVNVGTYLVDDETTITDVEDKYIKITVAINDSTGVLEVLAFEKEGELAEYGATPEGKTVCAELKEYTINSSVLVEVNDFIE